MDDALQNENLLIRYLDGELSLQEQADLQERLRTDRELQRQLESLQITMQAIRQYGAIQAVGNVHQEMMKELKQKQQPGVIHFSKYIRYTLAAAACLLLLFVGSKLLTPSVSPEKIYQDAFVDYNVSTARGSITNSSLIEQQYQQKNYAAVTSSIRSRKLSAKDSLLIGLSYLQTNKPSQAAGFFERLANTDNDFRQDAEFYLSLSYLKEKRYQQALNLLKKINEDPAHLYHEQIDKEMIEDVESLRK
jgi:tetratricopeptide (TPR) repeat protein